MNTPSKRKIAFYLLLFFTATLPFSIPLSNFALGGTLLALLYAAWPGQLSARNFIRQKSSIIVICFFILHIVGLLYSDDVAAGAFNLEKKLALLLIPMIFGFSQPAFSQKEHKAILYSFLSGISFAALFILTLAAFKYLMHPSFNMDLFFRTETVEYIQLHPSYFTIYSSFGILIAFAYLSKGTKTEKLMLSASILTNLSLMFFMAARMPLLAFFISAVSFAVFNFRSRKSYLILTSCVVAFAVLSTVAYQNSPAMQRRFKEITETKLAPPVGIHHNSTNLRVAQVLCTWDILKENWLLGVGTGDYQNNLNECYKSNGWSEVLYLNNFNAHNQYMETWLALGLPGLISLLAIFVYGLYGALRDKQYLFASFIILMGLCCLTESVLEKNKGIFFFTFFFIIFFQHKRHRMKSDTNRSTPKQFTKLSTEDQIL